MFHHKVVNFALLLLILSMYTRHTSSVAEVLQGADVADDTPKVISNDDMMNLYQKATGKPMPKTNPGAGGPPEEDEDEVDMEVREAAAKAAKKEKKKKALEEKKKLKSNKKKSAKDWNSLNVEEMSTEWEDGDEDAELEHEFERIQRIAAEKSKKASKVLQSGRQKDIQKVVESGAMDTKSSMTFVTLTELQPDGTPWNSPVQDVLCGRWSALLRTASLQANLYNMEPGQVLLQVDKGWMFKDVMKFIMQQPEVAKAYKDGKYYTPEEFKTSDDEL